MKLSFIATIAATIATTASAANLAALDAQCREEGGEFFAAQYRLNPSEGGVQKKLIYPQGVERPPEGVDLAFLPPGKMKEKTIYQTWKCQMTPPEGFNWD